MNVVEEMYENMDDFEKKIKADELSKKYNYRK